MMPLWKKEDKPRIYVAHTLGTRKWVKQQVFPCLEEAGFEVLDPFHNRRNAFENLSDEQIRAMLAKMDKTPRWVVSHDLKMIDNSDGVIVVNKNGPSYGSTYEAAYAAMVLNIPVAFVTSDPYLNHPWLKFFSIIVTNRFKHAVKLLAIWFGLGDYV